MQRGPSVASYDRYNRANSAILPTGPPVGAHLIASSSSRHAADSFAPGADDHVTTLLYGAVRYTSVSSQHVISLYSPGFPGTGIFVIRYGSSETVGACLTPFTRLILTGVAMYLPSAVTSTPWYAIDVGGAPNTAIAIIFAHVMNSHMTHAILRRFMICPGPPNGPPVAPLVNTNATDPSHAYSR